MRNALFCLTAVVCTSACSDGTGPRTPRAATVLYTDSSGHVSMVRSGEASVAVSSMDTTQLFASAPGGVIGLKFGKLYRFTLLDPVPRRVEAIENLWALMTRGAVSPDGKRIAYASAVTYSTGIDPVISVHTIELETGEHDSTNVSTRTDVAAGPQIIYSYPVWSPSGDSVAFLLPNMLGMQLLIYERTSQRIEVKPMAVPTSTTYHVLDGWPRWTRDGNIRFLTRRMLVAPYRLLDTLVVLQVGAREEVPHYSIVSRAIAPDSLLMSDPWSYSFSADGRTVAFAMSTGGRAAIMVMRQGDRRLETLSYQTRGPRSVILVPD
jgi:hypothetical protein